VKIDYRGFELSAKRERALGGWDNLYFYAMRKADGWMMEDSFTSGDDTPKTYIDILKGRVDEFYNNPLDELGCDLAVVDELLHSFTPEEIGKVFEAYAKTRAAQAGRDTF
jgi:hypothetical protein